MPFTHPQDPKPTKLQHVTVAIVVSRGNPPEASYKGTWTVEADTAGQVFNALRASMARFHELSPPTINH